MTLPNLPRLVAGCGPAELAPAQAAPLVRARQAVLVDVREPTEWAGGVAKSAVRLPFSDLTGENALWGPFLAQLGQRKLFIYSRTCAHSAEVAQRLNAAGVPAIDTGTLAEWDRAGWPVCKSRGARA